MTAARRVLGSSLNWRAALEHEGIPDLMVVRENYHGSPTPASNVLLVVEIVSPGGGVE